MVRICKSVFLLFLFVNISYSKKPAQVKIDGLLAAFGDFNSDKSTDLFVITKNRTEGDSFGVFKADTKKPEFQAKCDLCCSAPNDESIVGLIPGDFRGKALMDLVVITKSNGHKGNKDLFNLYLVIGNRSHLSCNTSRWAQSPFATVISQPLAFDYNGDMTVDLMAPDSNDSQIYAYTIINESTANKTLVLSPDIRNNINSRSPNSNAFIDLNGDFRSDLFIEYDKEFEYWIHKYMEHSSPRPFSFDQRGTFPNYALIGMSTFADINADGKVDHILPACKDKDCKESAILAYDMESKEWVTLVEHFFNPNNLNNSEAIVFYLNDKELSRFDIPLKLRHSDVDGDGFPDLVAIMRPISSNDAKRNMVVLLKNVKNETNFLKRSFESHWFLENPSFPLPKWAPNYASFFDLGEDGKPDLLITYLNKDTLDHRIGVIYNEEMVDACFLKVLVITGRCYINCPVTDSSTLASSGTVPYGTNQPGPAILYTLIDTEGNRRRGFAGQLSQSADFSLQTPYTIFGLGQMPNFVDNLTSSIPAAFDNKLRVASWLGIVPDAQVVIIPYPPDNPYNWRHKLFITPSDIVLSTFITLLCTCLLLLLIIILLHRKETLEDLAEHEIFKSHWPESR